MMTPEQTAVREVLRGLVRQPLRWNWKAAITSAAVRGLLFFSVNLAAGPDAAAAAFVTEFGLRVVTSGYYGAITQAFRSVQPPLAGTIATSLLLPAISHTVELMVHSWRGTEELWPSIIASLVFTAFSTAFNLHLMRHGVLTVGTGSKPLRADLRALPRLLATFFGIRMRPARILDSQA